MVGQFVATGTFGSTTLTSTGDIDVFIAKLSPTINIFTINSGAAYTNTTNVNLNVTCPIDAGVGGVQIAYGNTTGPSNWTACTGGNIAHTLTAGDGVKTVYIAFRDTFANTTSETTQSIFLDTTLPTITFTGSTPATNAIAGTVFTGQLDFTELNLGQFIRNRSGASYSMYDSGLVLMYNFDNVASLGEVSGSIVGDMALYDNTGTATNATWTGNGKRGGAYLFNGGNTFINIGNQPRSTLTEGTLSIWIRRDKLLTGYQMIFTDSASTLELCFSYDTLQFYTNNSALAQAGNTNTGRQLVTATFSSGSNIRKLFINGQLIATGTFNASVAPTQHYIGSRAGSMGFSGAIDEVRLFNRALSTGEITNLYYANLAKYDVNKWLFTTARSGTSILSNIAYSGQAIDLAGNMS